MKNTIFRIYSVVAYCWEINDVSKYRIAREKDADLWLNNCTIYTVIYNLSGLINYLTIDIVLQRIIKLQ